MPRSTHSTHSTSTSGSMREAPSAMPQPLIDLSKCRVPVQNTFIHFKFSIDAETSDEPANGPARRSVSVDSGTKRAPSDSGLRLFPRDCKESDSGSVLSNSLNYENTGDSSDQEATSSTGLASASESSTSSYFEFVAQVCKERDAGQGADVEASYPKDKKDMAQMGTPGGFPPGSWSLPNGVSLDSVDLAKLSSWGAAEHDKGNCRPCAWNWKPSGCSNGRNCTFCHSCDEHALKLRRRERIAALKTKNKQSGNQNEQIPAAVGYTSHHKAKVSL